MDQQFKCTRTALSEKKFTLEYKKIYICIEEKKKRDEYYREVIKINKNKI